MARKNNNKAEPVSETVEQVVEDAQAISDDAEAVRGAGEAIDKVEAEKSRTDVVNFLAGVVAELRSIEAGGEPELDLVKATTEAIKRVDAIGPELEPMRAAIAATQGEGATSQGVLDALGEEDRAEVELLVEALVVSEEVGGGESNASADAGVEDPPAERGIVTGRVAERVREAADLLGSKCQLTRAREDLAKARDAYLQGAAGIKAQVKELEAKRSALARAHRNANRKVEDAAARRHNRRNLVAGAINELDGLAQDLAGTDPHAAGHVFAAINVVKKDPDSPAAAAALRGLLDSA